MITRTRPIESTHGGRRPRHTGPAFTPEQITEALDRARAKRIAEDVRAYSIRKRTA